MKGGSGAVNLASPLVRKPATSTACGHVRIRADTGADLSWGHAESGGGVRGSPSRVCVRAVSRTHHLGRARREELGIVDPLEAGDGRAWRTRADRVRERR